MKHKKAFTLIELIVAITISSIVILGFTQIYISIQDSILFSQKKAVIFNDIKDFTTKLSYSTNIYNSGFVITQTGKFDTLIMTNSGGTDAYIIGVFDCTNTTGINIKLASDNLIYDNKCFGYFPIKQTQISSIITNNSSIYSASFNGGNLYSNLIVKNFGVKEFLPNHIFDLNIDFFDSFYPKLVSRIISDLNYDISKIVSVNINL
ncbi:MAG: prepilin-type N-terminal cleavage/methylation domain-containing protein [Candidatus Gracilibacteria bacterium]|nr:prepilin-type N-terminal cleavage/methylation domain-containing protein [Candidatus Gracilibacteria bacterium]